MGFWDSQGELDRGWLYVFLQLRYVGVFTSFSNNSFIDIGLGALISMEVRKHDKMWAIEPELERRNY
jgi:hypothetical protein